MLGRNPTGTALSQGHWSQSPTHFKEARSSFLLPDLFLQLTTVFMNSIISIQQDHLTWGNCVI
jgi:hypothetical protein